MTPSTLYFMIAVAAVLVVPLVAAIALAQHSAANYRRAR
jgi:hypothetical protein